MEPNKMPQTLHEMIEKLYGVRTDVKIKTVSVGTTPTRIIDNNPNRVGVIMVNLSSNSCFISYDTAVSTSNGILMSQLGGQYGMNWQDDLDVTGYEMWGVVASGSNNVYVAEIYIIGQ